MWSETIASSCGVKQSAAPDGQAQCVPAYRRTCMSVRRYALCVPAYRHACKPVQQPHYAMAAVHTMACREIGAEGMHASVPDDVPLQNIWLQSATCVRWRRGDSLETVTMTACPNGRRQMVHARTLSSAVRVSQRPLMIGVHHPRLNLEEAPPVVATKTTVLPTTPAVVPAATPVFSPPPPEVPAPALRPMTEHEQRLFVYMRADSGTASQAHVPPLSTATTEYRRQQRPVHVHQHMRSSRQPPLDTHSCMTIAWHVDRQAVQVWHNTGAILVRTSLLHLLALRVAAQCGCRGLLACGWCLTPLPARGGGGVSHSMPEVPEAGHPWPRVAASLRLTSAGQQSHGGPKRRLTCLL